MWSLGRASPGVDFYQFRVVAQAAGRGDGSVYDDDSRARVGTEFLRRATTDEDSEARRVAAQYRRVLEPLGTPFLYTVVRPLASGRYERDFRAFCLLSLASCLLGLFLIGRLLRYPPTTTLLLLAFVTLAFQPLKSDVRVGNVNQIQLGMLAAYLRLAGGPDRSRAQIAAGALLGAAVLFKPNLAGIVPLLAVSWLLHGRYRKLILQGAGLAAGVAAAVLASALLFGSLGAWSDWLATFRAFPLSTFRVEHGNFGLVRLAYEGLDVEIGPHLALAASAAILVCLWLGRRREGAATARGAEATLVGAGCLVPLLSAPLVWQHYVLLALPAVLVLLRPEEDPGRPGRGAWRRALTAVALTAIAIDPYAELFEMRGLTQQAVVVSAGLILLFVLTLREILIGELAPAGPPSPRRARLRSRAEDSARAAHATPAGL